MPGRRLAQKYEAYTGQIAFWVVVAGDIDSVAGALYSHQVER